MNVIATEDCEYRFGNPEAPSIRTLVTVFKRGEVFTVATEFADNYEIELPKDHPSGATRVRVPKDNFLSIGEMTAEDIAALGEFEKWLGVPDLLKSLKPPTGK